MNLESHVNLHVEIDGQEHQASGIGNGGFDAFVNAINTVLATINYELPKLINYEVRIPKGGETNALTECSITWGTESKNLKTRGIHANQVFAAILAALRVINLQLHERKTAG